METWQNKRDEQIEAKENIRIWTYNGTPELGPPRNPWSVHIWPIYAKLGAK